MCGARDSRRGSATREPSARGLVRSTERADNYLRGACCRVCCRFRWQPHRRVGDTRLLGRDPPRSVCPRYGAPRGSCLLYASQKPCRGAGHWGRRDDHHLRGHTWDEQQQVGELTVLSPNSPSPRAANLCLSHCARSIRVGAAWVALREVPGRVTRGRGSCERGEGCLSLAGRLDTDRGMRTSTRAVGMPQGTS
jgi:hypothetical protein